MEGLFRDIRNITVDQETPSSARPTLISPISQAEISQNGTNITDDQIIEQTDNSEPKTVQDVIGVLEEKPDQRLLSSSLKLLNDGNHRADAVVRPGPHSSRIAALLVLEVLPNHWPAVSGPTEPSTQGVKQAEERGSGSHLRKGLIECLTSFTGLSALTASLARSCAALSAASSRSAEAGLLHRLEWILQVISTLTSGLRLLSRLWTELADAYAGARPKLLAAWRELVNLLAGGRLLSVCLEATSVLQRHGRRLLKSYRRFDDPKQYCRWLGRSLVRMMDEKEATTELDDACSLMLGRALSLGEPEVFVRTFLMHWHRAENISSSATSRLGALLDLLRIADRKRLVTTTLKILALVLNDSPPADQAKDVGSGAALIRLLVGDQPSIAEELKAHLLGESLATSADSGPLCRAILLTLDQDEDSIERMLEESISRFGDKDYIRHAPVTRQRQLTQAMLLIAGRLQVRYPDKLVRQLRSGSYLTAVSNRLSASSVQTRLLGMIIGETFSQLVDGKADQLNLEDPETRTAEAQELIGLVKICDVIGTIETAWALLSRYPSPASKHSTTTHQQQPRPRSDVNGHHNADGMTIEQLSDGSPPLSSDSDPDLRPYAKPDSDPSDSDSDPTLVRRDRISRPVYVRELLALLRARDSYEKQAMAMRSAALLIRRKAGFGTEVLENLDDLAFLLLSAKDEFDLDGFDRLRHQGLVAVIVAAPDRMGPWFARTYFEGDYSLSQRAVTLAAIAYAAREMAGFHDADVQPADPHGERDFPSKQLPPALRAVYDALSPSEPAPTRNMALMMGQITQGMIQSRISAASGPTRGSQITPSPAVPAPVQDPDGGQLKPLATRVFSTRMAVERAKPKPRDLGFAKVLATCFFLPLTARFSSHLTANAHARLAPRLEPAPSRRPPAATQINGLYADPRHSPFTHPLLLGQYLQTLALILHAAGPSALHFPDMAAELLDLLLALRTAPVLRTESAALVELLRCLLTLLALHLDQDGGGGGGGARAADRRRLVVEHGPELVEIREWVGAVFAAAGGNAGSSVGALADVSGLVGGTGPKGVLAVGGDTERVRTLCAAILWDVQRLAEEHQQVLLGL